MGMMTNGSPKLKWSFMKNLTGGKPMIAQGGYESYFFVSLVFLINFIFLIGDTIQPISSLFLNEICSVGNVFDHPPSPSKSLPSIHHPLPSLIIHYNL